jgi:hypothetical protein
VGAFAAVTVTAAALITLQAALAVAAAAVLTPLACGVRLLTQLLVVVLMWTQTWGKQHVAPPQA